MGQTIEIRDAEIVGDSLLVSTDRSFTGQDGEQYAPGDPIVESDIFPARLAARLFEFDPAINHVYLMSNVLSIRRSRGWDDASVKSAREVVSSFFLFYDPQPPADA